MRKIYASAKENGIDNVLLHDMVSEITGKDSIKKLDKREAIEVIDKLVGKKPRKRPSQERATLSQLEKIAALEKELGWDSNPKRLRAFIKKYARTEQLHWLTELQASNIIEALKKLEKKGYSGVDKFSQ